MKAFAVKAFRCYDSDTTKRDILIDQAHAITIGLFLITVFFDWSYWKTAPYSMHNFILFGIIYTFLHLRVTDFTFFTDLANFQSQPFKFIPQAILCILAGLNSIILTVYLNYVTDVLSINYDIIRI